VATVELVRFRAAKDRTDGLLEARPAMLTTSEPIAKDSWAPDRTAKELWPEGRVIPRAGLSYEPGDSPTLAGPPEEIARRIEALRTAGADGLVITFGTEPEETVAAMKRFRREVAPHVGLLS
jgi:alkanesulfonate monooxygenase SsuD/methylene tetrahydromethanopterin reductase-like flavin-dependent oxidoreductase (luciferase family)